ncbi:MAG: flagellar biosynthesis protein FlhF [Oleiphilus sp.]
MEVKRFFSTTMQDALRLVREEFGSDAVILSNAKVEGGVEIVAALDYEEEWEQEPVKDEIASRGEPSPSQLARMHAEKHLQLQREMEQAKRKIEAVRAKKYQEPSVSQLNGAKSTTSAPSSPEQHASKQQNSVQESDALSAMRAEILEIKDLLAKQPTSAAREKALPQKSALEQQIDKMTESLCLSKSLKYQLNQEFQHWLKRSAALGNSTEPQFDDAWKHLSHFIEKSLRVEHTEIIDRQGVFALVGPTGSGKTMTIGKMAARYVMEYGADNIALVTTDRYRIAAHEQLKVFGRILNVPVHSVDESHSLDIILDKLSQKKVVLVDTAGLMHSDTCWTEQLQEIKLSRHNIECYLTVSAVGQYQVMSSIYHHYKMLKLAGVMVTKVDEAVSLGEVISFLVDTGLNASYFTDGQRVPEDIHLFDSHSMFQRAQTLLNSSERWVTIRADEKQGADFKTKMSQGIKESILFHSA